MWRVPFITCPSSIGKVHPSRDELLKPLEMDRRSRGLDFRRPSCVRGVYGVWCHEPKKECNVCTHHVVTVPLLIVWQITCVYRHLGTCMCCLIFRVCLLLAGRVIVRATSTVNFLTTSPLAAHRGIRGRWRGKGVRPPIAGHYACARFCRLLFPLSHGHSFRSTMIITYPMRVCTHDE